MKLSAAHMLALCLVAGACGGRNQPQTAEPAPANVGAATEDDPRWDADYQIRLRPVEPLVDATFEQETRGGKPRPTVSESDALGAQRILQAAQPDAKRCFVGETGVTEIPVRLRIGRGSHVTAVQVGAGGRSARSCLADALRSSSFPDPGSSYELHLSYVYRL